jgi:hypothetical protein
MSRFSWRSPFEIARTANLVAQSNAAVGLTESAQAIQLHMAYAPEPPFEGTNR